MLLADVELCTPVENRTFLKGFGFFCGCAYCIEELEFTIALYNSESLPIPDGLIRTLNLAKQAVTGLYSCRCKDYDRNLHRCQKTADSRALELRTDG